MIGNSVQVSMTDERLDLRVSAPGPLAHLRSAVSSQEVGYVVGWC